MKKIKAIILSLVLIASAFLSVSTVSAAGEITEVDFTYQGDPSHLYIYGVAVTGTYAVSIEVYDETGTSILDSLTTNTSVVSGQTVFGQDFDSITDSSKSYVVRVADYNGGEVEEITTAKVINSIELTVNPPKIGDTVTLVEKGTPPYTYKEPDLMPTASVSGDTAEVVLAVWDLDGTETDYFEGTFAADTDYYAFIDLLPESGYIFSQDLTITIKGGGTLLNKDIWPNGTGTGIMVKIRANASGEIESEIADTGTAPTRENTLSDKAISSISLGVSIVIASALVYGTHLFIEKKKAVRKK